MARPKKNTVDYFPHPCKNGQKMQYIQSKYGNDGYAVWYKILEQLGDSENHVIDLRNETQTMLLAGYCCVTKDRLNDIIGDLAELGALSKKLWSFRSGNEGFRHVYSQKFIDSISDVYSKRKTPIPNEDTFLVSESKTRVPEDNRVLNGVSDPVTRVSGVDNTQSKVKEIKVKKEPPSGDSPKFQKIVDLYWEVYETEFGAKPLWITSGPNNHPKAFQALAAFDKNEPHYRAVFENCAGDSFHRKNMEPRYCANHFNQLLNMKAPAQKDPGIFGVDYV